MEEERGEFGYGRKREFKPYLNLADRKTVADAIVVTRGLDHDLHGRLELLLHKMSGGKVPPVKLHPQKAGEKREP
jgi:hypothetical protein